MTTITNSTFNQDETDKTIRTFFNGIGVDLTGKSLVVKYDAIGKIKEIIVDPSVTLSPENIEDFRVEFFDMSIERIIDILLRPTLCTAHITGIDATTALRLSGVAGNTPTDLTTVAGWSFILEKDFVLTDADIGEVQYTGLIKRTVPISYSTSLTTVGGGNKLVFANLMRKTGAAVYTEMTGSRIFGDDSANGLFRNLSNRFFINVFPQEKFKLNVGKGTGTNDIDISNALFTIG